MNSQDNQLKSHTQTMIDVDAVLAWIEDSRKSHCPCETEYEEGFLDCLEAVKEYLETVGEEHVCRTI